MDVLTPGNYSGKRDDNSRVVLSLSSLSQSMASSDPNEAFQAVLEFVEALLGVPCAEILLQNSSNGSLVAAAVRNLPFNASTVSPCLGEGLARAAMEGIEPVCVDDLSLDARDALGSLQSAGYCSALFAPVTMGETPVGALAALSAEPRQFSISDIEILLELARLVSTYIANRGSGWTIVAQENPEALLAEAEEQNRQMQALSRLSESLIAATTLREALDICIDQASKALSAEIVSIMLFDPQNRRLSVAAAKGLSEDAVKGMGRALGEGIAGWVAEHQKPLLIPNIKGIPDSITLERNHELGSAISMPLRTRERLVGVFNVARKANAPAFRQSHCQVLEAISNQLALSMDRMRLQQEVNKRSIQLSTLMEIGKTITSMLDLGVVSEQIAVQARNLTRSETAFLYYYDPINDRVRFAAQSGCCANRLALYEKLARSLALTSARYNRLTLGSELRSPADRRLVAEVEGEQWSALPFRHRGHRIAVVVTIPRPGIPCDPDACELLDHFGALAAVAIQNARIYNREHAMAKVMQESVMHAGHKEIEGLEIAHRLIPAHEVGGDYYDFIQLGDGRLGVVMADVSGNSVRAAAYTTIGKHALRAYAREYRCPAEVLRRLNQLVYEESDAEIFISLFYALIDTEKSQITYAMAGHEPPLLLKSISGRSFRLKAPGLLLGIDPDVRFEARCAKFHPGDLVAMYTDGLTDAKVRGARFGIERLRDHIQRLSGHPVQDIVDHIIASRMRMAQNQIVDDMALVVIRSVR